MYLKIDKVYFIFEIDNDYIIAIFQWIYIEKSISNEWYDIEALNEPWGKLSYNSRIYIYI